MMKNNEHLKHHIFTRAAQAPEDHYVTGARLWNLAIDQTDTHLIQVWKLIAC